jgi:hypothetical protein
MAEYIVWARWYGSDAGAPHQQRCESGREAAAYIMERVPESARLSARIVFSDGTSLGLEDVKRIYEANKRAGK